MSSFSRCWSSLFISIPTAPLKRDLDGICPSPMNHFHHTSTVVLLLRSGALSATIPTIEFDKCSRFSEPARARQSSPWPPFTTCLSSCCLPSQAYSTGSPNSDGGRCYGWLIRQASRGKAKQNEARTVDKKNTISQTVSETYGCFVFCFLILSSLIIFTKPYL